MAAIRLYRVRTRTRERFIDNILVYLFAFRREACKMASATIYAAKKRSVQYCPRKLREQNSHFAKEIPTCRECMSGNRVHYVDVNNFAICNNFWLPIRCAFSVFIFIATDSTLKGEKVADIEIEFFFYFILSSNV